MTCNQGDSHRLSRSPSHDSLFSCSSSVNINTEQAANSSPTYLSQANRHGPDTNTNTPLSTTTQETSIDPSPTAPVTLRQETIPTLRWAENGLSVYPTWTVEPTMEAIIATLRSAVGFNNEYTVRFLHEGTLSKLYDVSFDNQDFVMRISLPVCPSAKTESEVATLDWVNRYTALPVPRVRAYDSSQNNPLGFEWILMTKLDGKPLSECWSAISTGCKERIVRQIAAFSASTFNQSFDGGIGSVLKTSHGYTIGKPVSMALF